jgi:hypothetical protein
MLVGGPKLNVGGGPKAKIRGERNILHSALRLLVTANVVPSSSILLTLMMETILSSETSVPTRVTPRNIAEDGILHSHPRENLKSYIVLTGSAL